MTLPITLYHFNMIWLHAKDLPGYNQQMFETLLQTMTDSGLVVNTPNAADTKRVDYPTLFLPRHQCRPGASTLDLTTKISSNNILLSICIASLESRTHLLATLIRKLWSIIPPKYNGMVEIITSVDAGEKPTGEKRTELYSKATGKYVTCLDDDDKVSDDYFVESLPILETSEYDAVGYLVEVRYDGRITGYARISNDYDDWKNGRPGDKFAYLRTMHHLAFVKRELAVQCPFPPTTRSEDYEFSKKLKPLLNKCYTIEKVLYFYINITKK